MSGVSSTTIVVGAPATLIAEALAKLLQCHGLHVVGHFASGDALTDKLARCRPEVALVDAALGAPEPEVLLCALRRACPETRVVVLAGAVDCALARAVTSCGVRAVVLASSPTVDVVSTIEQVAHGRTSFPASVLERLSERAAGGGDLSPRQHDVLERLALGRSYQEIAHELFISPNTVKFHVRAIYERLGVHNRVEAARLLDALADRGATRAGGQLPIPGGPQPPAGAIPPPLHGA